MSAQQPLRGEIERWAAESPPSNPTAARSAVERLLAALNDGSVRAAQMGPHGWEAVEWVKAGILMAFRIGQTARYGGPTAEHFDRDTLPLRRTDGVAERVRIVPGGTSIRNGVYLAPNVVIMPPAFINVGAYVGEGTMIDSHALVGSCAQIGAHVHISAGAQIGGVLEPIGLRPVVIEDEVVIGGNAGIFEGTLVGRRAVIAPGVTLTASTPIYDVIKQVVHRAQPGRPLSVPPAAVLVPGSRKIAGPFATEHGVQLYAPVIVKYRDERTDAATALESALR